ncbi:glycosyltransferase family 4 protein [Salinisphaera japonica]|uniref:glycosyltransferase family 4 protein n=1 Tax=Salinisphaera japonica TaxID=1304270 RepID=UPI000F4BF2F3|nr:glycosyltransferase family 4 protein [Salinisphaera japonica]
MTSVVFIVAGDPSQLTGGYIYDERIAAGLRHAGYAVETIGLAGRFPLADSRAQNAMADTLACLPADCHVVIDGLALGTLGATVAAHRGARRITALVHHPLADEAGLDAQQVTQLKTAEHAALAGVDHVIVTSAFTARRLSSAYDVATDRISVVEPGIPQPITPPRDRRAPPKRLLCIATLIPRKGHETLVTALAELAAHDWVCDLIGDATRAPAHAAAVTRAIEAAGLTDRIHLRGALAPEALAEAYQGADLFVLASHYEGYGMVITEAISHGLPVVTTTGGALADTLPSSAGLAAPPGDARALAAALSRCLDEPATYNDMVAGARRAAAGLNDWDAASRAFADALGLSSPAAP